VKHLRSDKQIEAISNIKSSFIDKLTKEQIDNYIDNNITDLSSAKAYLKKLSKVVLWILKSNSIQ